MLLRLALAASVLAAIPAAAGASSPDAWNEFRAEVRSACLAAGKTQGMANPRIVVHPFGTTSYGIAVLRQGDERKICVFDKQTKAVELT